MPTLLEISQDLIELNNAIEEAVGEDGEMTEEVSKMLDDWFAVAAQNRDEKMDNYGALVRERTLRAAARKEEMERLAMRVKVDENAVKYLKQRLFDFMEMHKTPKLETRRYKFSICGNGGVQPLEMPEKPETLPEPYQTKVVVANVTKLREDLAKGEVVEGCKLLPRGKHLRIT